MAKVLETQRMVKQLLGEKGVIETVTSMPRFDTIQQLIDFNPEAEERQLLVRILTRFCILRYSDYCSRVVVALH